MKYCPNSQRYPIGTRVQILPSAYIATVFGYEGKLATILCNDLENYTPDHGEYTVAIDGLPKSNFSIWHNDIQPIEKLDQTVLEDKELLPNKSLESKPEQGCVDMTLRDCIAIHALVGVLATPWHPEMGWAPGNGSPEAIKADAEQAYRYADAMLKAREEVKAA